jgi:hypothetical protein
VRVGEDHGSAGVIREQRRKEGNVSCQGWVGGCTQTTRPLSTGELLSLFPLLATSVISHGVQNEKQRKRSFKSQGEERNLTSPSSFPFFPSSFPPNGVFVLEETIVVDEPAAIDFEG